MHRLLVLLNESNATVHHRGGPDDLPWSIDSFHVEMLSSICLLEWLMGRPASRGPNMCLACWSGIVNIVITSRYLLALGLIDCDSRFGNQLFYSSLLFCPILCCAKAPEWRKSIQKWAVGTGSDSLPLGRAKVGNVCKCKHSSIFFPYAPRWFIARVRPCRLFSWWMSSVLCINNALNNKSNNT